MSVIRRIEVDNFRALKRFEWLPSAGINCLIGPGDSGKSSILDAIDFCIGARRNLQIADTDFHCLNVGAPIQISITLGELDDQLKTIDAYGLYLRAFDASTGAISDEPEAEQETVLTVQLAVQGDLEPQWTLVSERATAQSQTRNLNWNDRVRLAPTRLGAFDDHNLSWRRGSILNRLSEERADASAALVKAARDVREGFGEQANASGRRPGHYQAFLNLLRHAYLWDEARQLYGEIKVPVLVVYGDHDWSHIDERQRTVAAIPKAKMETVPEAGHFLSLDQPKRLIELIKAFA